MNSERIKLSGMIDPHVHLREPGATHKEDFESGTKAAIAGGYTTIVDMPNNPEPTTSPEALSTKITLAGNRIYCDVGFHFGATAGNSNFYEDMGEQVFGLKLYMNETTGPLLVEDENELQNVFSSWSNNNPIIVHAEGVRLEQAINLSRLSNKKLHVAHLSSKDDLEMIRSAKEKGLSITCEAAPHHLFLTRDDERYLGGQAIMKPSLKSENDRIALWEGISSGVIDIIATDHAPHSSQEKESDNPPFGVAGLETTLPLMLTAVSEGKIDLDSFTKLTNENPRKIFNIPSLLDSYVVIDLKESYVLDAKNMHSKSKSSPFDGKRVTGKIIEVIHRNKKVFDGEDFIGEPQGKVIYPIV